MPSHPSMATHSLLTRKFTIIYRGISDIQITICTPGNDRSFSNYFQIKLTGVIQKLEETILKKKKDQHIHCNNSLGTSDSHVNFSHVNFSHCSLPKLIPSCRAAAEPWLFAVCSRQPVLGRFTGCKARRNHGDHGFCPPLTHKLVIPL